MLVIGDSLLDAFLGCEEDILVVGCLDPGPNSEVNTAVCQLQHADRRSGFLQDTVIFVQNPCQDLLHLVEIIPVAHAGRNINPPDVFSRIVDTIVTRHLGIGHDDLLVVGRFQFRPYSAIHSCNVTTTCSIFVFLSVIRYCLCIRQCRRSAARLSALFINTLTF
jgi:hypothetical protein